MTSVVGALVFVGSVVFVGPCEGSVADVAATLLGAGVVPSAEGFSVVEGFVEEAVAGKVSGACAAIEGSLGG